MCYIRIYVYNTYRSLLRYVFMCALMHACIVYTCIHTHIHACTVYTYTYTCMQRVYIHDIHACNVRSRLQYVCMCALMHARMHAYVYVYTYTRIYVYSISCMQAARAKEAGTRIHVYPYIAAHVYTYIRI
jgi:hypothetical protein